MAGSNETTRAKPTEGPADPFKRAVVGCMRAIAGKPDLEVTFAADRPMLSGHKARLPEPPRKLTRGDVAITRGLGNSIALRLACHDPTVHRAHLPEGKNARAVFDAVEQARVEALGARRMTGVADNLAAMLEDRYHRGNYHEVSDRADAPLEDAVALVVRERLTGKAPPTSGRKVVELWRDWIEERAGDDLSRLAETIEDQRHFAGARPRPDRLARHGRRARRRRRRRRRGRERRGRRRRERRRVRLERCRRRRNPEEVEAAADDTEAGEGESSDADADEMIDDGEMSDARDTGEARRTPTPLLQPAADDRLQGLHHPLRRDRARRGSLRHGRARPAALLSRQAARQPPGRGRPPRQPAAAAADGAAEPRLGFRSRGRHDRRGAAVAGGHRSAPSAHLQGRARHRVPRHRGDAAPRQFRLDARPADHGRGDLRRHPRPHARTLRRQGRDPRLHHARLEGRPVARGVAAGRQAAERRAGSTTSATSSTRRRMRRGGARGAISG